MPKRSYRQDDCLPPQVLQINNQGCPTLFHRVTIPAEIGDDKTYPPKPGLYRNTLLVYEASHHVWMYSSDGIPTFISDGGHGVDDYNELTNKPSIEGHELVDDSSLEDIGVTDAIEEALEDYTPTSELAEVAFTGDYNDLSNKPTIGNATLTITQNGTSAGTFTANASSDTTISLTDTTYSDFSGATSSAAGAAGLVPAPAAGDQGKFLQGDGTWAVVQSGPTVVQTTGQSTADVMSQKAVTDIIGNIETILQTLNSGTGAQ